MQDASKHFPDFNKPPVIEVVCGVHFKSINNRFRLNRKRNW